MRRVAASAVLLAACSSEVERSPPAQRDAGFPEPDPPNACRFTEAYGPTAWIASGCGFSERRFLDLEGMATVAGEAPLTLALDEGPTVRVVAPFTFGLAERTRLWARVGSGEPLAAFALLVLREGGPEGRLVAAMWSGQEGLLAQVGEGTSFADDEGCAATTFPCGKVRARRLLAELGGERLEVPSEGDVHAGGYRVIHAHGHRYLARPACSETDETFTVGAIVADRKPGATVRSSSIAAPPGPFRSISAGARHACGVARDGTVTCWGEGAEAAPPAIFEDVAAGWTHTCARAAAGNAVCWGSAGAPGPFTQISAGRGYTCGVGSGGAVACWGPSAPVPPQGAFTQVSAGPSFACGVRTDRSADCWGPGEVPGPLPAGVSRVEAGTDRVCAVLDGGRAGCWAPYGRGCEALSAGPFRAIGVSRAIVCGLRMDGTLACEGPGATTPPAGAFTALSAGDEIACALDAAGRPTCWRPRW